MASRAAPIGRNRMAAIALAGAAVIAGGSIAYRTLHRDAPEAPWARRRLPMSRR